MAARRSFSPPITNKQKAIIHVGKQQIGLDDEAYRSILKETAGVTSSTKLDQYGYNRLMTRFNQLGFTPYHQSAAKSGRTTSPSPGKAPLMSKVGALLTELQLPWAYADGMARKMFGVASVNWLDPDQLQSLVAALNYHLKRQEAKEVQEDEEIVTAQSSCVSSSIGTSPLLRDGKNP